VVPLIEVSSLFLPPVRLLEAAAPAIVSTTQANLDRTGDLFCSEWRGTDWMRLEHHRSASVPPTSVPPDLVQR